MHIEIHKLVRSKRRTIALIVERDGSLTVRAPRRAAVAEIQSFIMEKQDWILRTQERFLSLGKTPKKDYKDGERFLFLGNEYGLSLVKPQQPVLKFENGFTLGSTVQNKGEQIFTQWYREQAHSVITDRVELFSVQYGFSPKRVKISSARTRWGSCSPDGTLNFTWRLVMAPMSVVDYVVVHELSHLRVKDHSNRFWREVEQIMPEYKNCRRWLRMYGETLNL